MINIKELTLAPVCPAPRREPVAPARVRLNKTHNTRAQA